MFSLRAHVKRTKHGTTAMYNADKAYSFNLKHITARFWAYFPSHMFGFFFCANTQMSYITLRKWHQLKSDSTELLRTHSICVFTVILTSSASFSSRSMTFFFYFSLLIWNVNAICIVNIHDMVNKNYCNRNYKTLTYATVSSLL